MFDVLTLAALTDELADRLVGGRIQKTLQLDESSIALEVYAGHQRLFLIASADARNPRLLLSAGRATADPDRVTPLLLLLRKYARGGQIVAVQQPPLERVVRLSIAKRFFTDKNGEPSRDDDEPAGDGQGELVYTDLIVEIMGRRSNILLVSESGRILDAIKRVTPDMSRVRPILPGRQYIPPPPQDKRDPRHLVTSDLLAILAGASPSEHLASLLVAQLAGMSPQMAREAVFRATGATDTRVADNQHTEQAAAALARAVASVLAPLETARWEPVIYRVDEQPVAFSPIPLLSLAGTAEEQHLSSISEAIEQAQTTGAQSAHVRHGQRRAKLAAAIQSGLDRAAARLRSLEEERARAEAAERWRQMGELIYAYLYQIEPGDTELSVEGREIPLDPSLTPSENAQEYFERYRKAQSAAENLPELIEQSQAEVDYLRQLKTLADLSEGIEEIEQLRREWEDWEARRRPADDVTQKRQGKGKKETPPKRPRPLRSASGDLIYIGHNGRQNDLVTFEIGAPDDTWLHARNMPGAHVLIHWSGPERDDVLEAAASLAAWYSEGREATSVEVDAAPRRHVRKIKGSGPGMVTYRHERTLNVRPRSPQDLGLE